MPVVRKVDEPAMHAMHVVEPQGMSVRSGLDTTMHPELVRRSQEGTLAPWYSRHPVLLVGGVLAAGAATWYLVRYLRRS